MFTAKGLALSRYDQAHCLHLDSVHGRVSLRNISDPALALPEYDLVIEVPGLQKQCRCNMFF